MISGDIKRYIAGQVTLNGATEQTITVPVLEADSVIVLSVNTPAGTVSASPYVSTKNVSTKTIGVKGNTSNTSVVDIVVFP